MNKAMALAAMVALAGCGEMVDDGAYSEYTGTDSGQGSGTSIDPGQLTAGDWDDNLNFELYQQYVSDYTQEHGGVAVMDCSDRIVLTVVNEYEMAVSGARVTIDDGSATVLSAPTASDGRVLLCPGLDGASSVEGLQITVEAPADEPSVDPVTVDAPAGTEWTVVLEGASAALPAALDLAFVIDATGSMSDEMRYLQDEIQSIVDMVEEHSSSASIHLALVVYRDQGDDYVTRAFDFTDSLDDFRSSLDAQMAGGGGDYPEAMHDALTDMNQLSWRSGNVARLAFLVADAPPHDDRVADTFDQVGVARTQGVKIYPVAASGVADLAEYVMRMSAQMTLARYIFLTDDSGIGGSHAEPHIPCYHVQYLNQLIARAIQSEMMGEHIAPAEDEIIRSVGEPEDGVCTLEDDSLAFL